MKKISLTILFVFLFVTNINANKTENKIDLQNAVIELPTQIKPKEEYEKKENLLEEPIQKENSLEKIDKDSIEFNADVDFDKKNKELEGLKLNLGTKF